MTTTVTKMTRVQFETILAEGDVATCLESLASAVATIGWMHAEMSDAMERGDDYSPCHCTNLTAAVGEAGRLGMKLAGLRSTLRILAEIQAG